MGFGTTTGEEVITSSGVVISSGKPVRIFNITAVSSATSGVELYNGTSKTGTARVGFACAAAGRSTTVNFEGGKLFPDGCYVYLESGTTQAVIECRLEI